MTLTSVRAGSLRRWVLVLLLSLCVSPATAEPVTQVFVKAEQLRTDALQLLERLVNIDSGTGDEKGLIQVGEIVVEELRKLGAHIRYVSSNARCR